MKRVRKNVRKTDSGRKGELQALTMTGVFAALITIMTAYLFHIPVGANGGYVHLGDSLIYLAAAILPLPYALAAAAIGGGLADLLTAPLWVPATIVIKMLLVLPFTNKGPKIIHKRNVVATAAAYVISGVGYFWAEYVLFGTWTTFWVIMAQVVVQSLGSAVVFWTVGMALDRVQVKTRLFKSI